MKRVGAVRQILSFYKNNRKWRRLVAYLGETLCAMLFRPVGFPFVLRKYQLHDLVHPQIKKRYFRVINRGSGSKNVNSVRQ